MGFSVIYQEEQLTKSNHYHYMHIYTYIYLYVHRCIHILYTYIKEAVIAAIDA